MPVSSSVSSGATDPNLVINGGTLYDVLSGGTITTATIAAGGSAIIEIGGLDSGTTIATSGQEQVYGSANGDIIAGLQTVGATATATGIVSNETILAGGVVSMAIKGTSASTMVVSSGGQLLINGSISANNTTLDGGDVGLESAKATLTGSLVFAGGGTLTVNANTSAGGYGDQAVMSGFAAGDTIDITAATTLGAATSDSVTSTTSAGNTYVTVSGGGVSDTFIFAGTSIGTNLALQSDGAGGEQLVFSAASAVTSVGSGMSATNVTVSSGTPVTVYNGGTLTGASVLSGGQLTVLAGGIDSGASIAASGSETLYGSAKADSIAGSQTVSGASAVATNETIQSGGSVTAGAGATVSGADVVSGGVLTLSGGATAANTTIAGGTVNLDTSTDTLTGGVIFNGPGTLDIDAVSSPGAGDQAVISGFYTGDFINISAFTSGTLSTTTSGGNTIATVTSGGASESVTFSGSVASNVTLATSGGVEQLGYAGPATLSGYTPGDLVLSIYGDGSGTGVVGLDQAAPITLEEITQSGSIVGVEELPTVTTVVNGVTEYAISGEYESASEGLLSLSADGRSVTIMGYGVNYQAFDATNAATVYGTAALGQTTSIQNTTVTAVPRVVADIGFNGQIDTSTAIYGIDNTNNPRSVVTVNGTTFYISGQGNGADGTEGVFVANDGANSATAIYNTKTDTRDIAIYNGQLYVSVDSKLNGGGGIYNFGTSLPTGATTPTVLPGIGASVVVTAAQANSVDAVGIGGGSITVNLSPEQYFYANATTLYVADGGVPKEGGTGDGGIQKWILTNGTWELQYTLTLPNQVGNSATTGITGAVGLTGTVEGGNVVLYTTNETAAETDPSYLFGITDALTATTLPVSDSFTLLETAAPGTLIRGVTFAPTASSTVSSLSGTQTITSGVSSGGITVASGGVLTVANGGTITGTTVLSGGSALISSGGADSATFVAHGGSETVIGSASYDIIDGTQLVSGGSAVVSNEVIENGGSLNLFIAGAVANATTVEAGGTLAISGHATAVNTVISSGLVVLESPKAVLSGALSFVGTGGTIEVTSATSATYGDLAAISGFGAGDIVEATIFGSNAVTSSIAVSGGNVVVSMSGNNTANGSASVETFIFASSGQISGSTYAANFAVTSVAVSGGGSVEEITYTPPPPVDTIVSAPLTSSSLSITSGNIITVLSGATMSGITVQSGGSAVISNGGEDLGSTIQAGGYEVVSGDANGDNIYGIQNVTSGPSGGTLPATIEGETVYAGGTVELYLKPDVSTNITVSSGGSFLLSGNVSATNTTLEAGAFMALQSPKATVSGNLVFNGAATIDVTAATSAGFGFYTAGVSGGSATYATISGFGAGDVIDETLISAGSIVTTTDTADNLTFVTVSGGTYPDTFVFAGTAIAADIGLQSDGSTGSELVYEPACFAEGTRIETVTGPRAIEELTAGDLVVTASGEVRPVTWLGYRAAELSRHPRPHDVMPVRVQAGAIADGVPVRDVLLSPDHAVFIEGVLIPVRYLLNGASIAQESAERITWWHVELDSHDVILSDGLASESYLDTGNRGAFSNAGPEHAVHMHADFARGVWAAEACAELVTDGAVLEAARIALLARLPDLGHRITDDADLRIEVDGVTLEPQTFGEWLCVVMPDAAGTLLLRSNVTQPAALQSLGTDWRKLGIAVQALRIDGVDVGLDAAIFGAGWDPAEDGLRWSNGAGTLTPHAGSVVEIRIASLLHYVVPVAAELRQAA